MDAWPLSDRFYADLPPFRDFDRFAEFAAYQPAPDDWVVLAGDIVSSETAIAAGRYKAVNMLGAAVIMAVLNACRGIDAPYAFGGDGGAVVVPGRLASEGIAALRRLQLHAARTFQLSLRAAAIPVSRLRAEGYDVRVRRLQLNGDNHIAMFAGGGLSRVDRIMKTSPHDPDVLSPAEDEAPPDLEGLTCRWAPLEAERGRMVALMARPVGADDEAGYARLLKGLSDILGDLPDHAPASDATLRFRWPPRGLWLEARLAGAGRRAFRALRWAFFTSAVQAWCHLRGTRAASYDAPRYVDDLKVQTDFRKFDDCLRVVLDCTPVQVAAMERWLEAEHAAGRMVYGMHDDRAAIMTCLVFNMERSQHVHFVDAAGGGFAKAAGAYKRRAADLRA